YLIVLTPVLPLLAAQVATRHWRGIAVLALGCLISFLVVHRAYDNARAAPVQAAPPDFRPLIAKLDQLGVHRVYSSYWVAYRLAFETKERIIGVKNDFTGVTWDGTQAQPVLGTFIRYPPWERKVREGRHAFVF